MDKNLSRTTILIDREVWKKFKIKAIEEETSASSLLEELIKKKIKEK
ncbi:MAG: hypothetical protein HYT70_00705 [Candidatus Aenigmarchaeota archaeon]|nr:hypothetical protein [Candidatus Aenigmarchaeota archaeon]